MTRPGRPYGPLCACSPVPPARPRPPCVRPYGPAPRPRAGYVRPGRGPRAPPAAAPRRRPPSPGHGRVRRRPRARTPGPPPVPRVRRAGAVRHDRPPVRPARVPPAVCGAARRVRPSPGCGTWRGWTSGAGRLRFGRGPGGFRRSGARGEDRRRGQGDLQTPLGPRVGRFRVGEDGAQGRLDLPLRRLGEPVPGLAGQLRGLPGERGDDAPALGGEFLEPGGVQGAVCLAQCLPQFQEAPGLLRAGARQQVRRPGRERGRRAAWMRRASSLRPAVLAAAARSSRRATKAAGDVV